MGDFLFNRSLTAIRTGSFTVPSIANGVTIDFEVQFDKPFTEIPQYVGITPNAWLNNFWITYYVPTINGFTVGIQNLNGADRTNVPFNYIAVQ